MTVINTTETNPLNVRVTSLDQQIANLQEEREAVLADIETRQGRQEFVLADGLHRRGWWLFIQADSDKGTKWYLCNPDQHSAVEGCGDPVETMIRGQFSGVLRRATEFLGIGGPCEGVSEIFRHLTNLTREDPGYEKMKTDWLVGRRDCRHPTDID